jgi:CRISPR/Cas system-associated exonuclease Cas4 (RecB family)
LEQGERFELSGSIDIFDIQSNVIWELKICDKLQDVYFLQVALYMCLLWKSQDILAKGYLFDVTTNDIYEIEYKDRDRIESIAVSLIKRARQENVENTSEEEFLESLNTKPII